MGSRYIVEHLNHLGIVAEDCREIGVVGWLDQQAPGHRQQVSVGMATVALVLKRNRTAKARCDGARDDARRPPRGFIPACWPRRPR
jgi:Domain of unknown function (DUF4277)